MNKWEGPLVFAGTLLVGLALIGLVYLLA